MKQYFISTTASHELVKKLLKDSIVAAPVKYGELSHIDDITAENIGNIDLSGFRTIEPFKSYIYKLIEKVSKYFGKDSAPKSKSIALLGVRGCDLEALEVLDMVFGEGEFKDPFYIENRKAVIIIGADCTSCSKTCFCSMVKGKPYPVKLFDINFSPVAGGYAVEVATDKGQRLIDGNSGLFEQSSTSQISEKEENRKKVLSLLEENNNSFKLKLDLSLIHKRNIENKIWKTLTKDCVECSSCNFICPTCTCFLLLDEAKGRDNERFKVWDACLKAGYQKVAGGANPRGKLYERLQNRYNCKFDYSFERLGRYTCVGCGRCIDGCAGNIDMRKIFIELEKQAPLTARLE